MGTQKTIPTAVGLGLFILFLAIWCWYIPMVYNNNIESGNTHAGYCASLAKQIESDKANHLNATILVTELNLYHSSCSS